MKLNSILFLFFVNILIAQTPCAINNILGEFVLSEVKYKQQKLDIDLSNILLDNRTEYLGFIGKNKKRLSIFLESVEQSLDANTCYVTKGKTTVYKGASREFNGEIKITRNYVYEKLLDDEVSYSSEITLQGFSVLSYELFENEKLSSTGVFQGIVLVNWYKDKEGKYHYDETLDYNPSYSNCSFTGTWKSFKTGKKSKTGWAHYRIPCSGDLDIGASEFSPNEKYYKYGWSNINNENKSKSLDKNSSFRKQWKGTYSFSLEDLTRMGETHSVYFDFNITNTNTPKVIRSLDNKPKKVKNCEITHITKDTLVLMDLDKNDDIYILSKDRNDNYNVAGSPIYLLNPPNESYPLSKN